MLKVFSRIYILILTTLTATSADENSEQEPPETPAPVFAARALKSAIFGTPAPPDDTTYQIESGTEKRVGKDLGKSELGNMSPTKPQGILLTPGTATSRRKTVSFGTGVVHREEMHIEGKGKSNDGDENLEPTLELSSKPGRKTSLTKTLEKAREGRNGKGSPDKTHHLSKSKASVDSGPYAEDMGVLAYSKKTDKCERSNQEIIEDLISGDDFDGNMTLDLNEPHSHSGKYWKSEYENYHQEARFEMRKLLKYKQLAKSYAKKKDAEAIELKEKLKEEQRRVLSMEDKLSKLSAQITSSCIDGKEDDSPELIKELARQTALAVQYRAQVKEFQVALEGNDELADDINEKRYTSPRTKQTLLETHHELKKAREQLQEIKSLREEINSLRKLLSLTEKDNVKLREENTKLTQELLHADLRLEKQAEKFERRRISSDDHVRRKDEAYQTLQKDYNNLKEQAKSQRRDAEQLLKRRHDQVVSLKKELASSKGMESTVKDLRATMEKKSTEQDKVVAGYLKQIAQLKGASSGESQIEPSREEIHTNQTKSGQDAARIELHPEAVPSTDNSHPRNSLIPVLSQTISRPSKSMIVSEYPLSKMPVGSPPPRNRSSYSALSEITNTASKERLAFRKSDLVQYTPLTNRLSNVSLDEPEIELPSPEHSLPRIPSRIIHERACQASPRPSMFSIASSPPKPAIIQSRDSPLSRHISKHDLTRRRHAHMSSSRLSSLEGSRARVALPPHRAAAAKARLEQRNAEKKRTHTVEAEKENIRT